MAEAAKRIPCDEFANNVSEFFDRVIHGNETVMVERDEGEIVVLKPASMKGRKRRNRTAADHEAFLSAFGSWSDFDVDTFLKNIYERRGMPPRPRVEL